MTVREELKECGTPESYLNDYKEVIDLIEKHRGEFEPCGLFEYEFEDQTKLAQDGSFCVEFENGEKILEIDLMSCDKGYVSMRGNGKHKMLWSTEEDTIRKGFEWLKK
jgi:hypothetical protein